MSHIAHHPIQPIANVAPAQPLNASRTNAAIDVGSRRMLVLLQPECKRDIAVFRHDRPAVHWTGDSMKLPDRILEPGERISEILFGLIMALTVTGATSIATADRFQIRTMLIAALGCNVAWGIIDAGMYLMARLIERGGNTLLLREIREAPDNQTAHRVIADALPPLLAAIFQPAQLELIREGFRRVPDSELRPRLTGRDWLGALTVCILVILSTFPVVIPFIIFENAQLALRISNAIAVALLFFCGFIFARHAGLRPWPMGLTMVAIGASLVGIAIALGG